MMGYCWVRYIALSDDLQDTLIGLYGEYRCKYKMADPLYNRYDGIMGTRQTEFWVIKKLFFFPHKI